MKFPETKDFDLGYTPKAQALKVLEEAAEFVEAVKWYLKAVDIEEETNGVWSAELSEEEARHEFCDVLQAMGNFAQLMGWEPEQIGESYSWVVKGNEARGRYE